jgi:MFS family permease
VAGIRRSLRIAEFRALLISYVINRAGDVFGALALAIVVLTTTRSAIAIAALFLATQFLPGLVGPFLVARIGNIPPGRILPLCYLVEACLFLVLAAIARHTGVALIVALAFLDGALAFAARSVTRATTASTLIPHDLMPEGKAAFNLALGVATVAGPVLGGVALALFGPATALAADGVSFLIAAVLLGCTPGLRASNEVASIASSRRGHVRAGLGYVARHPVLRVLIFGEGLAFVFFYLVVPVTVVYATHSLHAGPAGYAAILASWGAGAVIGSTMHVRLARRVGHATILISTAAVAIGYLGTALAPRLLFACGWSVLGGVGNGTQWVSVETAVHQLVEERFRLRVAAMLESMAALAPGVGIILGGALTALFSPRAAYLAAGLGLVALIAAVVLTRALATAGGVAATWRSTVGRPSPGRPR